MTRPMGPVQTYGTPAAEPQTYGTPNVDDLRQRIVATLDQHAALVFASGRVECVCGWRSDEYRYQEHAAEFVLATAMKHSVPTHLWRDAIAAVRLLGREVRRLRAELEER